MKGAVRLATSLALLALVAFWLDLGAIAGEFRGLIPGWIMMALGLSVIVHLVSAWRWRLTARRLGLELGWKQALEGYYLASFLNQVLPGGVAGDAARAWTHGRSIRQAGPAFRAVIIERGSGQIIVVMATLAILVSSPQWRAVIAGALADHRDLLVAAAGIVLAALVIAIALLRAFRPGTPAVLEVFFSDLGRALLDRRVLPWQLFGSAVIVACLAGMFIGAGKAVAPDLDSWLLLVLMPPVLLAMLIPFTVAGWGAREATAGLTWMAMGLPAVQGVAVSVTYGALILAASLPGALIIALAGGSKSAGHPAGQPGIRSNSQSGPQEKTRADGRRA